MGVKYPHIKVELIGQDGNAFHILARVKLALRNGGIEQVLITEFIDEAMSGNYNHLLDVVLKTVSTDVNG